MGDGVVDVPEVDQGHDLFGRHRGEQAPERFVFHFGVEVPDGVDEGAAGKVNDALLRAEPAELALVGELPGEGDEVFGDGTEPPPGDELRQILEGHDAKLGAAPQREGEAMTFEPGIGGEDAVGGGVVWIFIDRVGANAFA